MTSIGADAVYLSSNGDRMTDSPIANPLVNARPGLKLRFLPYVRGDEGLDAVRLEMGLADQKHLEVYHQPEASWRKMFITQPAVQAVTVRYTVHEKHCTTAKSRISVITRRLDVKTGITAGDVFSALGELSSPQKCTLGYECIAQRFEIVGKRNWRILPDNAQIEALPGASKYPATAVSTLVLNSQGFPRLQWEHQDSTQEQWEYHARRP